MLCAIAGNWRTGPRVSLCIRKDGITMLWTLLSFVLSWEDILIGYLGRRRIGMIRVGGFGLYSRNDICAHWNCSVWCSDVCFFTLDEWLISQWCLIYQSITRSCTQQQLGATDHITLLASPDTLDQSWQSARLQQNSVPLRLYSNRYLALQNTELPFAALRMTRFAGCPTTIVLPRSIRILCLLLLTSGIDS